MQLTAPPVSGQQGARLELQAAAGVAASVSLSHPQLVLLPFRDDVLPHLGRHPAGGRDRRGREMQRDLVVDTIVITRDWLSVAVDSSLGHIVIWGVSVPGQWI